MRQYVEPFPAREIAVEREDENMLYYADAQHERLAEVYHHDGQLCSATFYGQVEHEQVIAIAEHVKKVFKQDRFHNGLRHLTFLMKVVLFSKFAGDKRENK